MKKELFLSVYFLLSISCVAQAQEGLSLDGALQEAFRNNPQVLEERKEIEKAKGRHFQAEMLPAVEAGIGIGSLSRRADGSRKGHVDSFFVEQPLEPLGTRFLKGRIAKGKVQMARHAFRKTWFNIRRQVIDRYGQVLLSEKAHEIAKENLNVTQQFLTRVDSRYQSGSGLLSELLRARIEVSRSENELLVAEKNLKIAQAQLNVLLGRAPESAISLSDMLDYESLKYRYNEVKENALLQRSDVQIETLLLSEKQKEVMSETLKTVLPKISIGMERTMEDYELDTAFTIKGSYPLWGMNLGELKAAQAERDLQQVRLKATKREAGLDILQTFLEAELSDRQVLLQKKALDESNELLKQMTLQYEEGKLSFLAYLEHLKTIKETRLAYYESLKNYKEKIATLEQSLENVPLPEGDGKK